MRLTFGRFALAALVFALPSLALAGPPALPEGEPAPPDPPQPETAPAQPPVEGAPADPPQPEPAGPDAAADGSIEASGSVSGATDFEAAPTDGDDAAGAADTDAGAVAADSDPGMVRGRREPMMPTNRGAIGLFHTTLPDAGGRFTFRFRLHTDFFRKDGFIFESEAGEPDRHARVRGGVNIGFSPFEWGELFFSINSAANRNERDQPDRQDDDAIFALGDLDFGVKGAHRFKKVGIGLGGQLGLGLLSGSSRLLTSNVNFWFDVLFGVDVRYLTKNNFPFRYTLNLGWILDNSLKVADYSAITDPVSREVIRFSLGGNHNRVRIRNAVDFPIRLGKERQFGLDPFLEWAWDVSTQEEPAFLQPNIQSSPLARGSMWMTLGMRANVVAGLNISAGVDIGLVSPNFEYGPPQPPWQVVLGLGWSFDPKPVVKEVEAKDQPPPPAPTPALEGRILGTVVDPEGNPVPEAQIKFPGLASGAILTDGQGTFTSYRFPAGSVALQVVMKGEVVHEATAEVSDGQDTQLQIQLEKGPAPQFGIVNGAFKDDTGAPVLVKMHVTGQGVDEPFNGTPGGLIALELYEGEYRGTVSAPGFVEKQVTFTVIAKQEINFSETLTRDTPPATPLVSGSKRSIRLRKKIRYKGNAVSPSSYTVLDQLATFLIYHKEYAQVQVGVHTDDRGAAKKRTDERAAAVRTYLVGKGVSPDRLTAKGFGSGAPVAVNMTASGRAKNNRTVLRVLKKN